MKRCLKCDLLRPEREFNIQRRGSERTRGICKECQREESKRYRESNRKRLSASRHARYERLKAGGGLLKLNKDTRESARKLRLELIQAYGRRCACCGESAVEFLALDHINGGGNAHRKQMKTSTQIYRDLKRQGFPKDGFRLLCHNCNMATGFYGYCPHARAGEQGL